MTVNIDKYDPDWLAQVRKEKKKLAKLDLRKRRQFLFKKMLPWADLSKNFRKVR